VAKVGSEEVAKVGSEEVAKVRVELRYCRDFLEYEEEK